MSRVKKIADMAILLAIGVLLNIMSFPLSVGFFGRLSFVYMFCYICGILLGPVYGAVVVGIADFIPAMVLPNGGAWMPMITISVAMIAFIVGIVNKYVKLGFGARLTIGIVLAYLISTIVLTPIGEVPLFYLYPYTAAKTLGAALKIESPLVTLMVFKALTQPLWIVINGALTYVVCYKMRSVIKRRYAYDLGIRERGVKLKNMSSK